MSTAVTDVLDLDIHGLAIEVWPEVERIVKMRFPVDTDLTDGWTFTVPHPIAGDAYELTGEIGESDEDTPRPQVSFTMPADRMRDIMRQRFVIALDGVPKISGPIRVANVQALAGETTVSVTLVEPQAIDVSLTVVDGAGGGGSTDHAANEVAQVVLFLAVATTDGTNTSWDVLALDATAEADGLVPAGWASTVHLDMDGADFIALAAPDADPDTVFTVLVPAGDAVGVWQFTPATIEDPWTRVDVSLAYCTAPKWFGAATDAGAWVTLADPDGVAAALTDAIGDLPTRLFASGPSLGDRWAIVGKPNGENSWFTTPTWGSINTGNGWDTRAKLTILAPQPGVAPGDYWFAEWCTRERQAAGEWGSDQDDNEDAVYGADGRLGLFVEDCLTETPAETERGEDAAGRLYSLPPEALDLDYYDPTFQFTYGDVITVRKTYLFDDGNGNRVKTLWREVALADAEDTTADGRSWKRVVQNTIPGVGSIADSDQPWAIALSVNATFAIAWMEGRVGIDGTLALHFDADDAQADGTVVSSLVTHDYGAGVAPQTWTPNAAPGSPVAPIFVDTTLEEWAAKARHIDRLTPAVFGMVNSDGGAVTGREGAIRVGDNGSFALPTLAEADHGTPLWFFVRSTGATLDSVFVDGTGVVTDYPLTDGSTVLLRYYGYGAGYWDLVLDSSAGGGGGLDEAAVQALIDAAIAGLIDGAPGALDTLNELAAAINDDASFAAAVTTALAGKVGTDDARLTDARTPLAHEHAGADITSGTVPFARLPVGSGATQVAAGNDSRLSDARTPTDSSVTIAKLAAATIARLGTPLFVASDQASATDASFGNITGLTIPVTNGTTTYFEGVLDITGASAGDFRLSVTGPAGTIRVLLLGKNYASSGAGADFPYISQILAVGDGTPANDMATITGQSQLVLVRGHFIATADGTLQFRHAQRIANATPTTVKAGSNLTYRST